VCWSSTLKKVGHKAWICITFAHHIIDWTCGPAVEQSKMLRAWSSWVMCPWLAILHCTAHKQMCQRKNTCSKGIVESYLSMSKSDFYTRWMQRFNIRTFYSSAGQGSANTLLRVCSTSWKPLFGLYFLQDPALCLLKWQHHLTWRLSYSDSIGGQNDRVTELCQCISPFVQTKYHKDFLQIAHGPSQPAKSIETHLYFDPTLTQQPLWGREFGKE